MDEADDNPKRAIVLLGMSGSGKSYLGRALASKGFECVSIDEVIRDRLNAEDGLGLRSLQDVSHWMGFPDSETYPQRSQRYAALEADAVRETTLRSTVPSEIPLVIDTTGSVIYLEMSLLQQLSNVATIIHLETPPAVRKRMLTAFQAEPTPLIWGDAFQSEAGDDTLAALRRSYPALVDRREREYERWANITLSYDERRRTDFDPIAFLAEHKLLS